MIYGINFGEGPIPPNIKKRFADRLTASFKAVGADRGCAYTLQGVCNTEDECAMMVSQANNGHRRIYVTLPRTIDGKVWVGVYA